VENGTEKLVMTQEQFEKLNQRMAQYRRSYEALFLAFPGSELDFGGCLAAGKGFVHINAEGDVEPCPFSPYSDASLKGMSLIDALKSPLLKTIRDAELRLDESNGVCALWQNKDWVASLAEGTSTN
jgi:MoaA/NifB/PqqE/SkfB family radical SAM enzyme